MKNKNIMVVTKNLEDVMFFGEDMKFVSVNEEHNERIDFMSDNNHIYMDDIAFKAFNEKPFNNKFTRVFTTTKTFQKQASTKFRIHHISELRGLINTKDIYEPHTKIFFIGSSKFLKEVSKYCNTILMCEVNKKIDDNEETDKFPIEFKKEFSKVRKIEPSKLKEIEEFYKAKESFETKSNITIANNGMKIIDTSYDKLKNSEYKDIPYYMFYELTTN